MMGATINLFWNNNYNNDDQGACGTSVRTFQLE